jgi:surface polysaccharide O-acyltransferase-like enzyme|uniref:acyltransferase family protein n=1 Tax=Gemmiger formicilis TaxID=745368 RepID=UPI004029C282
MPGKTTRGSNLELLRILCMLLIIGDHLTGQSGIADYTTLLSSFAFCLIGCGSRIACSVFVLIGGWFLCEQPYKTRRPLSLWLSLWLYTVPVTLLCKLAGLDVSWGALRWAAFPASTRQLWFISDYLLLLLCVPLLNRLLRGLSRPAHRGLLAVLAVPLIVYPTLFGENGAVSDTAWMFLYEYLLIAYLRRWPDNRLAHLLQHRAAALGLGLGLPLLNTILRAVLETSGLTDGKAFQYMAYYRTALGALPNLLAALALFYLFRGLDLGCVRWVNALAGTTLGVYILHQVPAFRGFLWNGLLQAEAHHGSVGYTLLAILAVFLGCAAVDALRTVLVMRPLENTRLFKVLCEKGDALAAKITADD